MKTATILTMALLTLSILFTHINGLFAQSREDIHITENTTWSGNVSVTANTHINEDATLTIKPGATVTCDCFYGLRASGNILAEGTASDSIFFLPSNQSTGWNQIQFVFTNSSSNSSKFAYCNFNYGKANDENTLYGRFLLLINGATGIEKTPEDDGIEIYSYGNQIFIKTDEPGEVQVGVYNLLGQLVMSRTLHNSGSLAGLDTGFNLIAVRSGKTVGVKKIFIH